jgi:hypothetical protein
MDRKSWILALVVVTGILAAISSRRSLLTRDHATVDSIADPEAAAPSSDLTTEDPSPPAAPVKLIFIHHSCGENWLDDSDGGLGIALRDNNYFVADTNYGWGPDGVGDSTDIGHWWTWFQGPRSATYTAALYAEYAQHSSYSRLSADPGGDNEIIVFKSCYPNSYLGGSPTDPPTSGHNPLRGHDAYDDSMHTVANAKGIYNDLLTYFAARQDKLFVAITAPPQMASETDATHAANARAFNNWLVFNWLAGYAHGNVAVFDFYNVLTSNGGDPNTNDAGEEMGNHHRWWTGAVQHAQTVSGNYAAYPGGSGGGSHPTAAGNQKASAEFVPLLNVFYNGWKAGEACKALGGVEITGPISGYTDTLYAFTAEVSPTGASPPITYTWSPAPDAGSGGVVSYTWATTGAQTISLTAQNCGGSAADSHTVSIVPRRIYHRHLPVILKAFAPTPPSPPPSDLLQPSDLIYKGAFAYPTGDPWAYSGHALAYYPDGDSTGPADGYPGSLFAAGHAHHDLVGEMSIPEPVISDDFADLPRATVLWPLTDITGGWKDNCTYAEGCIYREVDGLEYLPHIDRIVWNLRDWYNTSGHDQDSLGWSSLDMSGPQGVWHIGERPSQMDVFHNAKTCNYLFTAPASFADEYLEGKRLFAGNHREAGAFGGSQGPTLYALAPWEDGNPPGSGQELDALPLLYYPEIYPECLDDPETCHFPGYRAKDAWGGGAWVQTEQKTGVLLVGRKGLGDNCYGTSDQCGGDACDPYRGYHAYPYEPQMLFYDPEDLREVATGIQQPWEVVPYTVYSPGTEVMDRACSILGAAAYDQQRGLLYVTEQEAGPWGESVVHVWQVD